MNRIWRVLLTAIVIALATGLPATANEKKVPIINVQLKEMPQLFKSGKAGFYKGTADEDGIRFYIPGLNIMTPAMIAVESLDPGTKLTLQLKNDYSTDWDRTVESDRQGIIKTNFRTEGPAVALIRSEGGRKPYRLVVWVGPEVKVHRLMPTPFISNEEYEEAQGSSTVWKYVVTGLIVLALGVLAVVARRRKEGV